MFTHNVVYDILQIVKIIYRCVTSVFAKIVSMSRLSEIITGKFTNF
jgi:hypothetical protein